MGTMGFHRTALFMESLEQVLEILERLRRARSVRDVAACVEDTLPRVGVAGYAIASLGADNTEQGRAILLERWDRAWMRTYRERAYLDVDPLLSCAERRVTPFSWSEVKATPTLSREGRAMFAEAQDHGLAGGMVFPIRSLAAPPAAVWFGGPREEVGSQATALLQVLAVNAHARLCGMVVHAVPAVPEKGGLTGRERECLQWCAEGKTSWEISQILSISQHTADWYLASATRKLAAANRLHATAEAIRRGLIS